MTELRLGWPGILGALLICGDPLLFVTPCLAGPPLVIDDPGILDPGSWEIIFSQAGEERTGGGGFEALSLDLSLGLSRNTQLSLLVPSQVVISTPRLDPWAFDVASIGYKWRFHASDDWEWAISTQYTMPVSHELIDYGDPDDVRVLALPMSVSRAAGDFTLFGQAGWSIDSHGNRSWDYGMAVSRQLGDSYAVMLEFSGSADASLNDTTLECRLGLDRQLRPSLHLLTSVGRDIHSAPDPDDRLDFRYFIGLQWIR